MQLLISTTSMTPIYEQIVDQIRALIKEGRLKAGEPLGFGSLPRSYLQNLRTDGEESVRRA